MIVGSILSVDLGRAHGCADPVGDGFLCWGDNAVGQADPVGMQIVPTPITFTTDTVLSYALGDQHTCALIRESMVAAPIFQCWGETHIDGSGNAQSGPIDVTNLAPLNVVKLAAADRGTCYSTTGNNLYCFGVNASSRFGDLLNPAPDEAQVLGDATAGGELIVDFALSSDNLCVLTNGGSMWCQGSNADNQIDRTGSQVISLFREQEWPWIAP